MTPITSEFNLDSVKMNQLAKCPGQRSFHSKLTIMTHTHIHWTDYSTWTTDEVDNNNK